MASTKQTIVGVFDEPSLADNAMNALESAGFNDSQIYFSGHRTNDDGFIAGLKGLFTGKDTTPTENVTDDLGNLGFSKEEANYYENEYRLGRTVIAIHAGDRQQEAHALLQANGAHSYNK